MDTFYMPTKVIFDEACIDKHKELLKDYGKTCLIVTGKSSAKKSGAYDDVVKVMDELGVTWYLFDEIMENPTFEILHKAGQLFMGKSIDFVVGIGGGSPLDASKMIGVVLKNKMEDVFELKDNGELESLPIIVVATTSGTGSETTPYSIITHVQEHQKLTTKPRIFPSLSLLDPKYFMTMPEAVTKSTAVDALSHLVEGYLVKNGSIYSDELALSGMKFFAKGSEALIKGTFTKEMHINLIHASTIAGMVISHTGTGIPHGMGYHLTLDDNVYHGKATALFLPALLELHNEKSAFGEKVADVLKVLNLPSVEAFKVMIESIIGNHEVSEAQVVRYTKAMSVNTRKLAAHDFDISYEDLDKAFRTSLKIKD